MKPSHSRIKRHKGLYGLTWHAMPTIDIGAASKTHPSEGTLGKALVSKLQDFSGELSSIKHASGELLGERKKSSI